MSGLTRGAAAWKQKTKERSTTSRRDTWHLKVNADASAVIRFCGLHREPLTESQIDRLSGARLEEAIVLYGAYPKKNKEGKHTETQHEALKRRMLEAEPLNFKSHWIHGVGSYTCNEDHAFGDDDCYVCYVKSTNARWKKAISFPRDTAGFSVIDRTKIHKIVTRDGDNEYEECTADEAPCKWCKRVDDKKVFAAFQRGLRKLELGTKRAAAVIAEHAALQRKCVWCSTKIKVTGYVCGNTKCGVELTDVEPDGLKVRCEECGKKTYPRERLACRGGCEVPLRGSLGDADFIMSREGSGKDDTTYRFEAQDFEPLTEEDAAYGVVDWMETLKPPSTSELSSKLGLSRDGATGRKVGASSFDDDDDDDKDDDIPY